jgi:HNH endonuclease
MMAVRLKNSTSIAIVDDNVADAVLKHEWRLTPAGYVMQAKRSATAIRLHNFVLGAVTNHRNVIDHINGDALDNRSINLRCCTQAKNCRNRKKTNSPTTSQFKGVRKYRDGRWHAYISVDRKWKHLGYYDRELDAAIAYNTAAVKLHGPYANLNLVS